MTIKTTEKTINKLNLALTGVINKDNEEMIFEAIISQSYHFGIDSIIVEKVITELAEQHEVENIYNYITYIDDLYTETEKPNSGLVGLKARLQAIIDKKTALKTVRLIEKELVKYEQKETYRMEVGTDKTVVMDKTSKTIYKENIIIKNKKDNSTYETVINAYPKEIIIHDSPITDEARSFSITWESKASTRNFTITQANIKDIEAYLEDAGYIVNPRGLKGTLASVIQISIDNNLATIKTTIDNPGFYYDEKTSKITNINYEITTPTKSELKSAIKVIDELGGWFDDQSDKLAHCLKWGFVAPFSYIKKQLGSWLPYLYLHGKAKAGKTTIAKIILYQWETPTSDNEVGGSMFDTVARVGNRLSQSTFPILVNEPAGAFNRPSVVEIIKNCVESTSSRGKYEGRSFKTIPAFAPVVFTANQFIPQDDALLRRFDILSFNHAERKGDEEKKLFEKEFKINNPTLSILNRLKHISHYFFNELKNNPELLSEDWQETANLLLSRLYLDLDMTMPTWLKEFCQTQTLEDLDDEETEIIRSFILERINKEAGQIKIYEEESYRLKTQPKISPHETKDKYDFKELIWDIANNNLISWLIHHVSKDNKNYICLNIGFKQDLQKNTNMNYELKSVAQMLEFDYKQVKLNGKNTKVIRVLLDDFVKFLYPTVEDNENIKTVDETVEIEQE